jgi:hypothetical protein
MKLRNTLVALASLACLTAAANAQQNESAIRTAASNSDVIVSAGQPMVFTASGLPTDIIETPFYTGRLDRAPYVTQVILNSGGNCSFRFCAPFNPAWNGTVVRLTSNGRFIDGDRVVCR